MQRRCMCNLSLTHSPLSVSSLLSPVCPLRRHHRAAQRPEERYRDRPPRAAREHRDLQARREPHRRRVAPDEAGTDAAQEEQACRRSSGGRARHRTGSRIRRAHADRRTRHHRVRTTRNASRLLPLLYSPLSPVHAGPVWCRASLRLSLTLRRLHSRARAAARLWQRAPSNSHRTTHKNTLALRHVCVLHGAVLFAALYFTQNWQLIPIRDRAQDAAGPREFEGGIVAAVPVSKQCTTCSVYELNRFGSSDARSSSGFGARGAMRDEEAKGEEELGKRGSVAAMRIAGIRLHWL